MHDLRKTFHAEAAHYVAMFRNLCLLLGAVLIAAAVIGQLRAGRFPAYRDLAIVLTLPFVAYAVLGGFIYLAARITTVRLGPAGIRCSNIFGWPVLVPWHTIRSADIRDVQGIPCIFLWIEGKSNPRTVGLWLRDPEGFRAAVKEYAGASNPLTKLVET